MAKYSVTIVTDAGVQLAARCMGQQKILEFVSFAAGAGDYSESERTPEALKLATSLKDKRQSFGFASKSSDGNQLKLNITLNNYTLEEGYFMKEFGVFARVKGSTEEPILYSITVAEVPDYMPSKNPEAPTALAMEYYTVVSNEVNVTIVIAMDAIAKASDIEALYGTDYRPESLNVHNLMLAVFGAKIMFEDRVEVNEESLIVNGEHLVVTPISNR